ncbi:hypothetical protein GCM10027615_59650 [Plantactinospora veratri]
MKTRQKARPVTIEMAFDPTVAYAMAVFSPMKARPSSTTSAVLLTDLPAVQAPAHGAEPVGGAPAGPNPCEPDPAGVFPANRWSAGHPWVGWIRPGGVGSGCTAKIVTRADIPSLKCGGASLGP